MGLLLAGCAGTPVDTDELRDDPGTEKGLHFFSRSTTTGPLVWLAAGLDTGGAEAKRFSEGRLVRASQRREP